MVTLSKTLLVLIRALKQWKCPGCGGSGKYQQRRFKPGTAEFENPVVDCTKCGGNGLHPIAATALAEANVSL